MNLDVVVFENDQCNELYNAAEDVFTSIYPDGIDNTLLCAGGGPGNDVCRVRRL